MAVIRSEDQFVAQNNLEVIACLGGLFTIVFAVLGIKIKWFKHRMTFDQLPVNETPRSSRERDTGPQLLNAVFRSSNEFDRFVQIEPPKELPPIRVPRTKRKAPIPLPRSSSNNDQSSMLVSDEPTPPPLPTSPIPNADPPSYVPTVPTKKHQNGKLPSPKSRPIDDVHSLPMNTPKNTDQNKLVTKPAQVEEINSIDTKVNVKKSPTKRDLGTKGMPSSKVKINLNSQNDHENTKENQIEPLEIKRSEFQSLPNINQSTNDEAAQISKSTKDISEIGPSKPTKKGGLFSFFQSSDNVAKPKSPKPPKTRYVRVKKTKNSAKNEKPEVSSSPEIVENHVPVDEKKKKPSKSELKAEKLKRKQEEAQKKATPKILNPMAGNSTQKVAESPAVDPLTSYQVAPVPKPRHSIDRTKSEKKVLFYQGSLDDDDNPDNALFDKIKPVIPSVPIQKPSSPLSDTSDNDSWNMVARHRQNTRAIAVAQANKVPVKNTSKQNESMATASIHKPKTMRAMRDNQNSGDNKNRLKLKKNDEESDTEA